MREMNQSITVYSSLKKQKIAVEDLQIGMFVCELDRPWLGTPFQFQGFEIKTFAEIESLRRFCKHVYIDIKSYTKHFDEAPQKPSSEPESGLAQEVPLSGNEAIRIVSKKVKLDVDDLKPGMYVCELDRPWTQTPFKFQGFEIKNPSEIEMLRKYCDFIYIDTKQIEIVSSPESPDVAAAYYPPEEIDKTPRRKRPFQQEIQIAQKIHHTGNELIHSFIDDIRMRRPVDTRATKQLVSRCVDSILHVPDALMWMTNLKHRDEYTAEHCLNVGIMAIAFGRHLGLNIEELNQIGLCGMMHDLGKIRIPKDILNKPGRLNEDEMRIMQTHTVNGMLLLTASRDIDHGAVEVAYNHHERLDGKGYPRKISGKKISLYTRLVAIVDMYDAITSNRVYQTGRPHIDAIKIMTQAGGSHLDADLTVKFIEFLGIYPCGSVVEMSSGEIGIVVETNPRHKLRPKIITLLDHNKQPTPPRWIDLSMEYDALGKGITIKNTVDPAAFDIDVNRCYKNLLHT